MSHTDFLRQCRHWIFDLDGTLTQAVHDFDHIRRELRIPDGEDILSFISRLPPNEQRQKSQQLDELEYFYAKQAMPAVGLASLFDRLVERHCTFAILTRNTHEFALMSLEAIGIGQHFAPDMVLGRDEAEPKPSPDGIHKILNAWNVEASEALMVGDFIYDLAAGHAAACKTVHVDTDKNRNWPELTHYRFTTLTELAACV